MTRSFNLEQIDHRRFHCHASEPLSVGGWNEPVLGSYYEHDRDCDTLHPDFDRPDVLVQEEWLPVESRKQGCSNIRDAYERVFHNQTLVRILQWERPHSVSRHRAAKRPAIRENLSVVYRQLGKCVLRNSVGISPQPLFRRYAFAVPEPSVVHDEYIC
jgi:hypothetical protein